ncbi:hypothetical protein GF359_05695 [candidate division WOR-3 bacterium]|uniref:Leucine-rich repeat domain-containing protein n=1 Tax=candidate division WOR-3 bacterium TaxID=2052148 RepID=A0A9D5KAR6_UNCW3|nr:hypothetical protein [candidate division WOR-3 bacterium]MBD3364690.1 hypothetical protein [candidate division WOR-3 bacterium]
MFELEVLRDGVAEYKDESTLAVDERSLKLGEFLYLWQGERRIDYRIADGLLFVGGKLAGINLTETQPSISDSGMPASVVINAFQINKGLSRGFTTVKIRGSIAKYDNKALKYLQDLKNPKLVWWDDCHQVNPALRYIGKCRGLKVLGLRYSGLTDKGLANLSRCRDMRVLDIEGSRAFTGEGLKHLKGLTLLKRLNLSGTGINELNLRFIDPLFRLQEIFLGKTSISEEGAIILGGYRNLRYIDLRDTKISQKALQRLRERLPESKILSDIRTGT